MVDCQEATCQLTVILSAVWPDSMICGSVDFVSQTRGTIYGEKDKPASYSSAILFLLTRNKKQCWDDLVIGTDHVITDGSVGNATTDLNLCGLWTVKVGGSEVAVCHMRWGVRGWPSAVLLQNLKVGLCVKVCPPQQHLNESTCISQTLETRWIFYI